MSPSETPSGTNAAGKLSLFTKAAYGSGGAAECVMANLVLILALPIFNLGLGIDAGWIGLALLIQKFWDVVTDPVMGNISDNTRSRFGRRKPYIFIGAILTGLLCIAMWIPPVGASDKMLMTYFVVITVLYYTSYTIFFVPYNALGFEMSSDYDERTKLMGAKTLFMNFANLAFLPFAYKLCFILGDGDEVRGVRFVGMIYACIIIVFGILPAILCKEREISQKQEKTPFFESIFTTLSNKPFMILCGVIFTMLSAAIIGGPLMNYINIAYTLNNEQSLVEYQKELPELLEDKKWDEEFKELKDSDDSYTYREFAESKIADSKTTFQEFVAQRGEECNIYLKYIKDKASNFMLYGMIIYGSAGILSVPLLSILGSRFGKRRTLMGGIILAGFAYGMSWFYITPALPWLHLIYGAMASPALAAVWMFTYAMTADVCDVDELKTGKRREGTFGAVYSLVMKTSAMLVVFVSALVVKWVAFDTDNAIQSVATVTKMRAFFAFAPLTFLVIAFFLTYKFPITRAKMQEVQEQLSQRKASQ